MISEMWKGWMFRVCGIMSVITDNYIDFEKENIEILTPISLAMVMMAVVLVVIVSIFEWLGKKIYSEFPDISDFVFNKFENILDTLIEKFGEKWFSIKLNKISETDKVNYYKYAKMFYKKILVGENYYHKTKAKLDDNYYRAREEQLIVKIAGIK